MQTYDGDIVAWAREQADLLRAGQFHLLDVEHVAEEIEDVGKSEQRELASRMAVLLAQLLKWETQPERRGPSWESTIREQRRALLRRLRHTPSLRRCLEEPEWWDDAWLDARTAVHFDVSAMSRIFSEIIDFGQCPSLRGIFSQIPSVGKERGDCLKCTPLNLKPLLSIARSGSRTRYPTG